MLSKIKYSAEIFKEDDQYVAICHELGVSSFGNEPRSAEEGLKEAVALFIEECQRMGTLEEVLEEAGYHRSEEDPSKWVPREPVAVEKIEMTLSIR